MKMDNGPARGPKNRAISHVLSSDMRILPLYMSGVMFLAAVSLQADTIAAGGKSMEGTFTGFEQSRFYFKDSGGKTYRVLRTQVQKLALPKPYQIRFIQSGVRDPQEGVLFGYADGRYSIQQLGHKRKIPGIEIRKITVEGAATSESGGGAAGPAPIDIAGLRARGDLTPAQTAAINRFETAQKKHQAFREQSSALVSRMDSAKGDQRMQMLASLRERKNLEQPLLGELQESREALLAVLPDAGAPQRTANKQEAELTLVVPRHDPGTVVLIDTGFLETEGGPLSADQKSAIQRYKKACQAYANYRPSSDPDASVRVHQIAMAIEDAEKGLLSAFPKLRIIEQ